MLKIPKALKSTGKQRKKYGTCSVSIFDTSRQEELEERIRQNMDDAEDISDENRRFSVQIKSFGFQFPSQESLIVLQALDTAIEALKIPTDCQIPKIDKEMFEPYGLSWIRILSAKQKKSIERGKGEDGEKYDATGKQLYEVTAKCRRIQSISDPQPVADTGLNTITVTFAAPKTHDTWLLDLSALRSLKTVWKPGCQVRYAGPGSGDMNPVLGRVVNVGAIDTAPALLRSPYNCLHVEWQATHEQDTRPDGLPVFVSPWEVQKVRMSDAVCNDMLFLSRDHQILENRTGSTLHKKIERLIIQMLSESKTQEEASNTNHRSMLLSSSPSELEYYFNQSKSQRWFSAYNSYQELYKDIVRACSYECLVRPKVVKGLSELFSSPSNSEKNQLDSASRTDELGYEVSPSNDMKKVQSSAGQADRETLQGNFAGQAAGQTLQFTSAVAPASVEDDAEDSPSSPLMC